MEGEGLKRESVADLRAMVNDAGLLPVKADVAGDRVEAGEGATCEVPARGEGIATLPDPRRCASSVRKGGGRSRASGNS